MDRRHSSTTSAETTTPHESTLSERIAVLVLAQVGLGVLLILYDLARFRDLPAQLPQTLLLVGSALLISGVLYLFRHTRAAPALVYLNLTLDAFLIVIADLISGNFGGSTWVLLQIWPPLAVLTLRRPHAVASVVIPVTLLASTTPLAIFQIIPIELSATSGALLRNMVYQILVLTVLSVALYVLSNREQRALSAANVARARLQGELEKARVLAAEKDELNTTLEAKVAERSAVAEQRAAALARSEERYALASRGTNDGLLDWNLATGQLLFSPRWQAMRGYAEDETIGQPDDWFRQVHPDDRSQLQQRLAPSELSAGDTIALEYRMAHRDGSYRWMLYRGLVVHAADRQAIRMVGSQTDITDRKLAEERLRFDALHDALTGLPNRVLFMDRLRHAIQVRRASPESFAVFFLDLDRFKTINDSLGHLSGDELLIGVAQRLAGTLRIGDTIARFGGDEFAILLDQLSQPADVLDIVERIQAVFEEPFVIHGHDIFSSASIGIALGSTRYERPEDMLRDADAAMYRSKQQRSQYAIFDTAMHARALLRLQVEGDLYRAIERDELRLHYQPIIDLKSERLMGFEALARWQHPTRGMVMPGEFIAIAEETGLIGEIGAWSLQEACRQLAAWQQAQPVMPRLFMSVNIAAPQLAQPHIVVQVAELIARYGLEPWQLKLEIVESTLVSEGDVAISVCHQLKQLGVQLSIDDFGTGYSSLSYLHRFPLDTVKIDRSFISRLGIADEHTKIVTAIIALGRALGLRIIAEGVETHDQLQQLRSFDCDYGQGWLFARALASDQAAVLIAAEADMTRQ